MGGTGWFWERMGMSSSRSGLASQILTVDSKRGPGAYLESAYGNLIDNKNRQ